MGFFSWLGGLFNQLVNWLGRVLMAFIEALVNIIQALWNAIVAALVAAFEYAQTLYATFYAGASPFETLMEIWDPRYLNKPAQVFKIGVAPPNTGLAKSRVEVDRVFTLENIRY